MIKLFRVDFRLLHGQIAFGWANMVGADCILLASDSLIRDEVRKSVEKLSKPTGVKLVIKSLNDSVEALNSGVTDKYKLMVIVETVKDAAYLAEKCECFKSLNIGNTPPIPNSETIGYAVRLTKDDKLLIENMKKKGLEVEVRHNSSDKKIVL